MNTHHHHKVYDIVTNVYLFFFFYKFCRYIQESILIEINIYIFYLLSFFLYKSTYQEKFNLIWKHSSNKKSIFLFRLYQNKYKNKLNSINLNSVKH